jgi:hypothetical protein
VTTPSGFSQFLSKWINKGLRNGGAISNAASIFGFLAPVGPAVLGTYLMNNQYKKNKMPEDDRKMLISQEIASQGVNVFAHWMSFSLFFLITRKVINHYGDPKLLLPRKAPDGRELNKEYQDAAAAIRNMACALGGFFGMSVVRPLLAATILKEWKKREQAEKDNAAGTPAAPGAVPAVKPSPPQAANPTKPLNVVSNAAPMNINAFAFPVAPAPSGMNSAGGGNFANTNMVIPMTPILPNNVAYGPAMGPMRRTAVGG